MMTTKRLKAGGDPDLQISEGAGGGVIQTLSEIRGTVSNKFFV